MEIDKKILKSIWKHINPRTSKKILKMKKVRQFILPDFKIYHKARAVELNEGKSDPEGDIKQCLKCSKFSKPDFSNMWTMNFQMFKLVLEKPEEPEIKLPTSAGSSKKQESSRKTSISALLTMPKPLTVWITTHCGKFWKRWKYQTTWPGSWKTCMQIRKQQLEVDMEQQTGSK